MNRAVSCRLAISTALLAWCAVGIGQATPQQAEKPGVDPFAEENKIGGKPGPATTPEQQPEQKTPRIPTADRIDFQVGVLPTKARRGEFVKLTIVGTLRPGFHTYPLTKRTETQPEAMLSSINFKPSPGLQALWPVSESPDPEMVFEAGLKEFNLEYKEKFTWVQEILILPDAAPGASVLRFGVRVQVCDTTCVTGEHPFEIPITVTDAAAVPLSAALQKRLGQSQPEAEVISVPAFPAVGDPSASKPATAPQPKQKAPSAEAPAPSGPPTPTPPDLSVLAFVLQGIGWGAISLLTPCVFPMIPITVSYFLKQAEKEHHRPLAMASVYSGTIVLVLTLGGLVLMTSLQRLGQHWSTNLVLGGLFLVFALSLFGMYEIQLPSSLANLTSAQEGKGGLLGVMFMALTFTIISFACVAPFYGGFIALAAAATTLQAWLRLAAGALAFSVTFASPFFVLALFPTLLRSLPRSGSWMNTIKVVMGFLEMAAAFKFLRAAELTYYGKAGFLTYDLVLGIYVAITLLCGLYLLNLYRLPHDHEPKEQLGVPRLLFSLLFLTLSFYLFPGLFKSAGGEQQRPQGTLFSWMDAFLLPDDPEPSAMAQAGGRGVGGNVEALVWVGNLERGLQDAANRNRLVFLDFTGINCTNCKINERTVFPQPAVKRLLSQYILVQLYTDKVPPKYEPTTSADENSQLLTEGFGTAQLPLYVLLKPAGNGKYDVIDKYVEGKINDVDAFVEFLRKPLQGEHSKATVARAGGN